MPLVYKSHVDTVTDALITRFTSALAGTNVQVKDGQWVSEESAGNYVVVGWTGFVPGYQYPSRSMSEQLFGPAVVAQSMKEGLGPSILETVDVTCACISRDGAGATITGVRQAVKGNYNLCGQAIAQDGTLGGATMKTLIGLSYERHAVLDRRGSLCVAQFTVQCVAYSQQ